MGDRITQPPGSDPHEDVRHVVREEMREGFNRIYQMVASLTVRQDALEERLDELDVRITALEYCKTNGGGI